MALHHRLNSNPFAGFIESVPAYSSLAVFYDLVMVSKQKKNHQTAFDFVKELIEKLIGQIELNPTNETGRLVEVPVQYNGEDLEGVAALHHVSVDEVILLHTSLEYRVYMIGFLPGFAYMGTVDHRIAAPRRKSPRTSVPSGSVGIAGLQTGIYPIASPGGWQLIGRTPKRVFDKMKITPCLFQPGDRVRFYAIDQTEFNNLNEH
jgi:inhibitor of KinA